MGSLLRLNMICVTQKPLSLVNIHDMSHENRIIALHITLNSELVQRP